MNKGFDNFTADFKEIDAFLDYLDTRENGTERITTEAASVKFCTIKKALTKYNTVEKLAQALGVDEALVEDTQNHTDIIVSINRKPYLLGDSAWISLSGRMQIFGGGFQQIGSELQSRVLNRRFADLGKAVKVIIAENKVRAIMSMEYAFIPTNQVVREVLKTVEQRFGDFEMVSNQIDHSITRIKIKMPLLAQDINQVYGLPDEFTPGLLIETSDTGFSANKISAFWLSAKGGSFISENENLYMVHIGNTKLDDILDELPNLFLRYQNIPKKLAALMQQTLEYPITVFRKACDHLKVPKKIAKQGRLQFESDYANAPQITAYDVCKQIFYLSSLVDDDNKKTALEEIVGKAINLNYGKLDKEDDE